MELIFNINVRRPEISSDFVGFYFLIFPIFLEVIVFGFIMGELMEKYNPIITSRILAKHRRNHTVIIGYGHLSTRLVDFCIENKRTFSLIEDDAETVEDLISNGFPVIVGDATDPFNLEFANIAQAKEIFICVNDVRVAIICTEKIRKINNKCPIYVRAFEEHVHSYLRQPRLNAFPFSTSKATMDDIEQWTKEKTGNAVVIGRDHLTQRIAHSISLQEKREVYFFNDENDGILFAENAHLHIINEFVYLLSDLRPHVNLNEITQIFICWKRDSEFDNSLYLVSKIALKYPEIEVFVRVFDVELVDLVKRYNAKTFSSSESTFKYLQRNVPKDSALALK